MALLMGMPLLPLLRDVFYDGFESAEDYEKYGDAFIKVPWRVYLLRCADGSLYCGVTVDMQGRFKKHQAGTASKYTRSRLPVELELVTRPMSQTAAMRIESAVKKLPKERKVEVLDALRDKEFTLDHDGGEAEAPVAS